MLAIYGRARVGNAVFELAKSVGISAVILDDSESEFNPSIYSGVIPSPGVNPHNRAFRGSNALSELDFASAFLPEGFTIIAITGTDGKSTTAWMLYQFLCAEHGSSVVWLSGNFEIPFSQTVQLIRESGVKRGYIVVEVSSFMANGLGTNLKRINEILEDKNQNWMDLLSNPPIITGFAPDITIFTNFERDHLDWHDGVAEYFAAKMRLVEKTRVRSYLGTSVYRWMSELNYLRTSPEVNSQSHKARALLMPTKIESCEFWEDISLQYRTDGTNIFIGEEHVCSLNESVFGGRHNALNLLSVTAVMQDLGASSVNIRTHLPQISNLPHRLEFVGEYRGVRFVDDSKSTSAQSLRAGLSAYATKNIILIAGGHDKWDIFTGLVPDFAAKVRQVVCIGATAPAFMAVAQAADVPSIEAKSMDSAVNLAMSAAKSGDTILLSPGCASFGMFQNYLDRAEQFCAAFSKLEVQ